MLLLMNQRPAQLLRGQRTTLHVPQHRTVHVSNMQGLSSPADPQNVCICPALYQVPPLQQPLGIAHTAMRLECTHSMTDAARTAMRLHAGPVF